MVILRELIYVREYRTMNFKKPVRVVGGAEQNAGLQPMIGGSLPNDWACLRTELSATHNLVRLVTI